MAPPTGSQDRLSRAELLLQQHYAQGSTGSPAEIEALAAAHADLAAELRELHEACGELNRALAVGRSDHAHQLLQLKRMLAEVREDAGTSARYLIEGEIGKGGMGAVMRVRDTKLDRTLAMKVILGQADASRTGRTPPIAPRQLARFLNEARIMSRLDHPGIVPVHEIGVDKEGCAFFTMKLVQGRTLAEIYRLHAAGDAEWTKERVLWLLQRACEALAYAHERGVVHRDLKPTNMMVGRFGEVYVMDWGLARGPGKNEEALGARGNGSVDAELAAELCAELSAHVTRTHEGMLIGTPAYMPPEQALGRIRELGPRSDVYAVGAMLYELLAGHAPYCGPGSSTGVSDVLDMVRREPPAPIPAQRASPELSAICGKAMAREADDRYADMEALAADLRAYLERRVVSAYETGAWAEAKKWVERNPARAAALGAAVFVLIAGLVAVSMLKAQADRRANDVLSLAAIQELRELEERADTLWPPYPENLSAYEAWLADARVLIEGRAADRRRDLRAHPSLADHEAKLAELRERAKPLNSEQSASALDREVGQRQVWEFDDAQDRWWHEQLSQLVTDLKAFQNESRGGLYSLGTSPQHGWGVVRRVEFSRTIEKRSVSTPEARERWLEAIESIARSECYRGATWPSGERLAPQLGLLPIGPDPDSGLWEFAHLLTGEPAERGPDGRLVLQDATGVVLVLLPGGTFLMGAQRGNPEGANYDPQAQPEESPVREVAVGPYFISKYEMTQGQWKRATGRLPSTLVEPLLHPAREVNWYDCTQVCKRIGLVLPTEAQWEHAARAGTRTPWWTGADRESLRLRNAVNAADQAALRCGWWRWPGSKDWPELDDGFAECAAVNRLAANPFGLYNVHGNVWEWCQDDGPTAPDRGGVPFRVHRGGGYSDLSADTRSSTRSFTTPLWVSGNLGLRPARIVGPK
jgi:serine/threonine protein kinase/formylglycine-generating enzyme required for sulfatase activity